MNQHLISKIRRIRVFFIRRVKIITCFAITIWYDSLSYNAAAQNKSNQNLMPAKVNQWMKKELMKNSGRPPVYFNSKSFFQQDTAHLIGYIAGYHTSLGFSTGIVYVGNELTLDEYPIVVKIYPDGRFEANLPLTHPKQLLLKLNQQYIDFYIEPRHTLGIIINWDEFLKARKLPDERYRFKQIIYKGALGEINKNLDGFNDEHLNYAELDRKLETLSPQDFKADVSLNADTRIRQLEGYGRKYEIMPQAYTLLKNKILLESAIEIFDYVIRKRNRSKFISEVLTDAKFYDFLKNTPLNERSLLVDHDFEAFINRLEYCAPVLIQSGRSNSLSERWRLSDSTINQLSGVDNSLTNDIIKIRALKFEFENYGLTRESATIFWDSLKTRITEPYCISTGNHILNNTFSSEPRKAYQLPRNAAGQIFKKIIRPYTGKVLFVDFWATTCGPCVGNIEEMKSIREKYKGNKDFDFLFITDERESPATDYYKFVKDQNLVHTERLSNDEFNYLRQLFKFNGIPHYVVVNANGDILNDDFPMENFTNELEKILSARNK